MCTFSLLRLPRSEGYAVLFNRDEQHRRAPEIAPRLENTPSGLRFTAPIDGQTGGAWLMVNSAGLLACVMNDYLHPAPSHPARLSRGLLPRLAADAHHADAGLARIRDFISAGGGPGRFPPFHFIVIDRAGGGRRLDWNGAELREHPAGDFHTTSSFEPERIARQRREARAALPAANAAASLVAFHWVHDAAAPARSVRMWREDACTRSVTEVRVGLDGVLLRHHRVDWSRRDGRGSSTEVRL